MPLTSLSERARTVIVTCSVVCLAALPFIGFTAAQPQQAARAAVVAVAAILAAVLGVDRLGRRGRIASIVVGVFAALYAISALVNGPWSAIFGVYGRYQGLVSALAYILSGALGVLVLHRYVRQLSIAIAIVASAQSLVLLVQSLSGADPIGTMMNRDLSGAWLSVAASVVLAAAITSRGRTRTWLFAAAAVTAVGVGVAGSRGAWIGLAVGVPTALVASRNKQALAIGAASLVALLLLGMVLSGSAALSRLSPSALTSGSAASRWQIWRGTALMVADHPLLGIGPGRFLYEFPTYEPIERAAIEGGDTRVDQAHSVFLQVGAESGIPAGLVFAGLFVFALVSAAQAVRKRDGAALIALAGLAAYTAQGLFGISTIQTDALAWLLGGIAFARADRASQPVQKKRGKGPAPSEVAARPAHETWMQVGLVCAGLAVFSIFVWYFVADARYRTGTALFQAGEFAPAQEAYQSASRVVPYVDIYRVAQSDSALYQRGQSLDLALRSLAAGMRLEPDSYDLALAKARVLRALGRSDSEVAEAYERAIGLYPLGIEVRREAIDVLRATGREDRAVELETDLQQLELLRARTENTSE